MSRLVCIFVFLFIISAITFKVEAKIAYLPQYSFNTQDELWNIYKYNSLIKAKIDECYDSNYGDKDEEFSSQCYTMISKYDNYYLLIYIKVSSSGMWGSLYVYKDKDEDYIAQMDLLPYWDYELFLSQIAVSADSKKIAYLGYHSGEIHELNLEDKEIETVSTTLLSDFSFIGCEKTVGSGYWEEDCSNLKKDISAKILSSRNLEIIKSFEIISPINFISKSKTNFNVKIDINSHKEYLTFMQSNLDNFNSRKFTHKIKFLNHEIYIEGFPQGKERFDVTPSTYIIDSKNKDKISRVVLFQGVYDIYADNKYLYILGDEFSYILDVNNSVYMRVENFNPDLSQLQKIQWAKIS